MCDEPQSMESLLLDLHLDQLDPDQARETREAMAASAELASQSRALREVLGLLDAYDAPEPPHDLTATVMARIEEHARLLPFKEAASAVPAGTAQDLSASPVLSLRELIAIAACITLFVGVFVPGYFKARNIARQNVCQKHLCDIWQGSAAYAQENQGYLAWAGYVPNGSWLPARTPNVRRVSNTRPTYKLLRHGFVSDARIFICPSMPHTRPMLAEDYRAFDDFAEPANVTYSFQFMNVPQGRRVKDMSPRMVLVADPNPLFDSRAAGRRINPYDDATNSFAHGEGVGQNAVYIGGRGGWFTEPRIGVNGDNIYRAGELTHYEGTESPISDTDTLLVP